MSGTSLVLLTYNGEKYLAQLLEMVSRQKTAVAETIAIDSGSFDATLDILRRFAVKIHEIPQQEFGHSRTRNFAAHLARENYIAFLTQDATPADSCWLERLEAGFYNFPNVAGAFSRQIPRPNSDLLNANDLRMYFSNQRYVRSEILAGVDIWKAIQFSNASALYDRRLLLENPFNETLQMGEDQEWAKRMLESGYSIVYEPESMVLHSHDHTLREKYHRNLQMGKSFSQFLSPVLGRRTFPFGGWLYHVASDLKFIPGADAGWREKFRWLCRSPIHRAAMHYAYYKGWNDRGAGVSARDGIVRPIPPTIRT
ncbi:MAG TPA: glycosyltransferase family 2 protein [Acidobacteriota bacterium]